jgi:hypothetical protein
MGEHGAQMKHARGLINCRGLDDRDLMLAQRLANDFKAIGKGCVAEGVLNLACSAGANGGSE